MAVFDNNTIYAIHDSQFRRSSEDKKEETSALTKDDFKTMSVDALLNLEDKKLNAFLKTNGFQEKYRAPNVKQLVRSGSVKPIDLAKYLEDANSMLFDTPVIGAEVYKSTDGGITWNKTHDDFLDGLYYSYGYYFGHIYVEYDLTIIDKGRKELLKENEDLKIDKAKNGKHYLPKGKYTIQIGSEKTALEVK